MLVPVSQFFLIVTPPIVSIPVAASGFGTPTPSLSSFDVVSMQIITTKLNGSNCLLWAKAMKVAFGGRKKLKYITSDAPAKGSKEYEGWVFENYVVMSWLWNSMEPTIASSVMFLSYY